MVTVSISDAVAPPVLLRIPARPGEKRTCFLSRSLFYTSVKRCAFPWFEIKYQLIPTYVKTSNTLQSYRVTQERVSFVILNFEGGESVAEEAEMPVFSTDFAVDNAAPRNCELFLYLLDWKIGTGFVAVGDGVLGNV